MYITLITLIIAAFIALLFLNVYFRVKVIKIYRVLVKNNIEFGAKHVFNDKKLKEEVLPMYPEHQEDILNFAKHLKFSTRMASVLFALICLFGFVLMRYGNA